MNKTRGQLADGREIIWFDDTGDAARTLVDQRDLAPSTPAPTLRYDVLAGEWVAVAQHRQARTHLPPVEACPLCPTRDGRQTEIPSSDYDVVVFENRFPSFGGRGPADASDRAEGLFRQRRGRGRCEVVCFTSQHNSSFSALTPRRVRTVVEAWVDRTAELSALPGVAQVFCFENRGREIGVTLSHPHGQIYGYPYVTPRTRRMLDSARRYRSRTGANLFADVLAAEVEHAERVVVASALWTAFVPYAARWPVEVHLYPNDRVPSLPELSEAQRHDLCAVYLDLLRRLESVHGSEVPYMAGWHQSPVRAGRDLAYLHLEIASIRRAPGRLKYLAGSESTMGAFVNDVVPEEAAGALRCAGPASVDR